MKKTIKTANQIMSTEEAAKKLTDLLLGKEQSAKVIHVDFNSIKHTEATKQAMKSKVVKVSRISSTELKRLTSEGYIVIVT